MKKSRSESVPVFSWIKRIVGSRRRRLISERRQYERAQYAAAVRWERLNSRLGGIGEIPDVIEDISIGGICMVVYDNVSVGDELKLQFSLADKKKVEIKGAVRWIQKVKLFERDNRMTKHRVGIEFEAVTEKDREFIRKIIRL